MIQLGTYNSLTILRETDPGLFLGDDESNEVLLPHKYKPENFSIGDSIDVFVYLDNEERPIATTQKPALVLDTFAYLRCEEVNKFGAFMDWGLTKQLFVPFKEQITPFKEGRRYIVYLYLDEKTNRLVGSNKTFNFTENENLTVAEKEEVSILITHISEHGAHAIVNQKHAGLIHTSNIFEDLRPGDILPAHIKKIRHDKKIDLVLQVPGYKSIEPNAKYILEELEAAGGFLPLHDKSEPETIKNELGISKKSFKKAIGTLYKNKLITLREDGIERVE